MTKAATIAEKKFNKKRGPFGAFIRKLKMRLLAKFKKKDPNIYPVY